MQRSDVDHGIDALHECSNSFSINNVDAVLSPWSRLQINANDVVLRGKLPGYFRT